MTDDARDIHSKTKKVISRLFLYFSSTPRKRRRDSSEVSAVSADYCVCVLGEISLVAANVAQLHCASKAATKLRQTVEDFLLNVIYHQLFLRPQNGYYTLIS